ncbi:MAG: hypothetical protein K2H93_08700 [Oscillospiraceae bacterium]|nr:hypothetical protein [Oscillospiraceae bacterium]
MKKILSLFCMVNLLLCNIHSISVNATEVEEPCTEIVEAHYEGLVNYYVLSVSNYNGSLCVNAETFAPYYMEEIGIKDLIVQYSYDNEHWYDEWNAGNFLAYNAGNYGLFNYIIALERSGCYYRVTCKHYAKESFWKTQSNPNTSNSVWIP